MNKSLSQSDTPQKNMRILLVDDNPADILLIKASLRRSVLQKFEFIEFYEAEQVLDFFTKREDEDFPQCMLIDVNMPRLDGFEITRKLNAIWGGHPPLPMIFLTGSSHNEVIEMEEASLAHGLGAQDYISKSSLCEGLLNRVIHNAIERFRLIEENRDMVARINAREEQYRLATEAVELGTWAFTGDGRFKCNENCRRLHGISSTAEFVGEDEFLKNMPVDDARRFIDKLRDLIRSADGEDFKIDCTIKQANGPSRWISEKGRVYRELYMEPRVIGIVQDITHQKQVGDVLRNSEARLRQLADSMPQMVWITLPNGQSEYFNQRWYDFTGLPTGSRFSERESWVFHADDRERVWKTWYNSLSTQEPYEIEYRLRHHNGEFRWVLARAVPVIDEQGVLQRWYGTCTDIHAQLEREQLIRRMIESSPDCIKVLDLQGRLLSINEKGMQQLELDSFSTCEGRLWSEFWGGEESKQASQSLERARRGEMSSFDGYCLTSKGTPKWWEVVVTPLLGPTGEPEKILVISRDISQRKRIENELVEALKTAEDARQKAEAANSAKSEFLANMSHEIRTPMNAVVGLSNILAQSHSATQRQKECISTLQLSANSLLALINDLLDVSKIETQSLKLEQTPFDLKRLIHDVIDIQSVSSLQKDLRLMFTDKCSGRPIYVGDQVRLKQVLMNLCSNAVKFTDHGFVELTLEAASSPSENRDIVTITCVDSGIGIRPEDMDSIFEKFVQADSSITRKYGGTGLGLAITKTLVEIMGGTITVASRLGIGSTFTVAIPFHRATNDESAAFGGELKEREGQRQPCVLLVEDYPANVLVATMFLEQFGYAYDVASNGFEAFDKVKEGRDYMAILMDVQMQGMNGIEATRSIRQHEQELNLRPIPIIGMTAHALAGDKQHCLEVGMNDYISKPFNPDELCEKLSTLGCAIVSQH